MTKSTNVYTPVQLGQGDEGSAYGRVPHAVEVGRRHGHRAVRCGDEWRGWQQQAVAGLSVHCWNEGNVLFNHKLNTFY